MRKRREEDIQGSRFSYIAESKDHALPRILFKAEGGIYCFGPIVADPRVPFSQKARHQDAKKDCLLFLILQTDISHCDCLLNLTISR